MSDASRTSLVFRPETLWAETVTPPVATTRMRFTGENLSIKNATVLSEEIRADRQRTDMPLVGIDAAGDINLEMLYGEPHDTLLQAVLCGTWTGTITDGATTTASAVVTSATAVFVAGDVGKPISGTGIPANTYIGIRNSATSIGLSSSPSANTPVNITGTGQTGVTLTIGGRLANLRNGVTNRSFGIEAQFLDVPAFIYHDGCIPSKYSLDIAARQIIKNQFSFMGRKGAVLATSICGGGTVPFTTPPTEPTTSAPMLAGPAISILSAGTANTEMTGVTARRISIDIANSLRPREIATQFFGAEPGRNVMEITGTIETYFDSIARYNAFLANGNFAAKFRMTSSDLVAPVGNTYEFTFPKLKVSAADVAIPGNEADVFQTFNWRALLDSAVGYVVNVQRSVVV